MEIRGSSLNPAGLRWLELLFPGSVAHGRQHRCHRSQRSLPCCRLTRAFSCWVVGSCKGQRRQGELPGGPNCSSPSPLVGMLGRALVGDAQKSPRWGCSEKSLRNQSLKLFIWNGCWFSSFRNISVTTFAILRGGK